ncbi:hypothetical protein CYR55_05450 [Chimaeribacter californicus]|uniref:Uncharacterized protein n=1 Tax=Chimaeribacter californicus TaxID=2060067 RepID=A0A2N5EDZ6_9GAMM|nr:hypothetical protein [Chimaeribacter californicus]PLR40726.1 hypothetical protein CYR55_05450 [Chimaeribacter californicus]
MLENYFLKTTPNGVTQKEFQRLLAVQAAVEIIKASVGSGSLAHDAESVEKHVSKIADAIQEALAK